MRASKTNIQNTPHYKKAENKAYLLEYVLQSIIADFYGYYRKQEYQLLVDNQTPWILDIDFSKKSIEWREDLLERVKELEGVESKFKKDTLLLRNYFQKVLARCDNFCQLYCYIPAYLHPKLNEVLKGSESLRVPIQDLEPDPEMIKLIDFYVMFRLLV